MVFAEYKNQPVLVGYFTLSNKYLVVKRDGQISETLRKRIAKFCTYNHDMKRHELAAPLIAQLGKNFANGFDQLITGDELLQMACDRVASVLLALGGKIAYVECEPNAKLISFYERNRFREFDRRFLDKSERERYHCDCFIQMLRYFMSIPIC